MARGDSRYDTLLRVRQRQEEQKATALAVVRREIQTTEQQREEIERQQRQILDQANQAVRSEFRAADVDMYYRYERHLARLAVEKDAHIAELKTAETKRRVELEDAFKSRRMVEKLSEKEIAAYRAVVGKNEQAVLDETATNHAAMSRHGNGPC